MTRFNCIIVLSTSNLSKDKASSFNSLSLERQMFNNRPVSYSQLPLITMTIDSFSQYEPQLDVLKIFINTGEI